MILLLMPPVAAFSATAAVVLFGEDFGAADFVATGAFVLACVLPFVPGAARPLFAGSAIALAARLRATFDAGFADPLVDAFTSVSTLAGVAGRVAPTRASEPLLVPVTGFLGSVLGLLTR